MSNPTVNGQKSSQAILPVISIEEQIKALQEQKKLLKAQAKTPVFKPSVEFAEYQGKPMLRLRRHDGFERFPFQIGLNKAKLIVALYSEIKKFAESAVDTSVGF